MSIATGWSILTVISNHTLKTEKNSLSLKVKLFFHSQHREFLIFSFQIIPESISNYSSLKTFEVHKCESMENTLKINVFWKTILFCKYLHHKSSDLYEIWNLSSLDSNGAIHRFLWRSVHRDAHERRKRARARFIARARVFATCARLCARIFMKIWIYLNHYLMSLSFKFHKDPSFRCGDICKTILTFWKLKFSGHFLYFHIYAPQKSSKMNNYWMIIECFGN